MYPYCVTVKIQNHIWTFDPIDGDRMAWDLRQWFLDTIDGEWSVYFTYCEQRAAQVADFRFAQESDAVAFKLRWA